MRLVNIDGRTLTRLALGALLCTGATAKTLWPDDGLLQFGGRFGLWLPALLLIMELVLGLWLVIGVWSHWASRVAAAAFLSFAIVSGAKALQGHETCNCFGALIPNMSPWLSLAIDVSAIALLLPSLRYVAPSPVRSEMGHSRWLPRITTRPILALGFAGIAAYWVATAPQRAAPNLIVGDRHLDVGDVWETTDFIRTIPIYNRSREDVNIRRFEGACDCIRSVEPNSLTVPSKRTAAVQLELDLTRRPRSGQERSDELRLAIAAVVGEDDLRRVVWVLRGRARPFYKIVPGAIHLGNLTRGQPFRSQVALVTTDRAADSLELEYDRSLLSVTARPQDELGNSFDLTVAVQPNAPAGAFNSAIRIQALRPAGDPLPTTDLAVRGLIKEDAQAIPSSILCGALPIGKTIEETVVLQSLSGATFSLFAQSHGRRIL
jgi:hypothetical protein